MPHNQQSDNRLSALLAEIVILLFEELKLARNQQLSADDIALLGEMLADMEQRALKLESLDAKTPPSV